MTNTNIVITKEIWSEFKKYRQDLLDAYYSDPEYKRVDSIHKSLIGRYRPNMSYKEATKLYEEDIRVTREEIYPSKRHIPELTLEDCEMWVLNGKE